MSLTNFTPLDAIADQDAIELALQKVLSSETFTSAPRLQRFLEYVVLETVAGNNAKLKGFTIAYDVFDRKNTDEAQTTTIVRVEAGRLRKRLENYYESEGRDDSIRIEIPKGRYIASFTKKVPAVSTVPDADAMSDVESHIPDSLPEPPPDTVTPGPFSDRPGLVWALIALVAFFCGVWSSNALTNFTLNRSTPEKAEKSHQISPNYTKPTIAILPLEVYEKSEAINGLALSITEALISEIGRIREINVIALSSMRYYRDNVTSVKDIGATLAASHVFKGGLSKNDAGLLFINLALYDAGTGFVKWTTDIELPQFPKNKVRSQVVAKSLSAISRELGIGEENLSPEKQLAEFDSEEHNLYRQGLDLMHPPSDLMRMNLAHDIFKQIVQNNPDSAEGHAGSAFVHASRLWWGHSDFPDADVSAARFEADIALKLNPNLLMPHVSLALLALNEKNHGRALSLLEKAVEILPNNSYALSYLASFKIFAGEEDDSLQLIQQAIRLDPLNRRAPYWNILGVVHFHRQEYKQALTAFLENSRRSGPFGPHMKAYLAATYFKTENYAEAKRLAKSLAMDTSDFDWQQWITRSFKDPLEGEKVSSVIEQAVLDTASAR